jgi:hypothetical protein
LNLNFERNKKNTPATDKNIPEKVRGRMGEALNGSEKNANTSIKEASINITEANIEVNFLQYL